MSALTISPDLSAGATSVRTRSGFTGLMWNPVKTALSPGARDVLRRDLIPVAMQAFDGTEADYWNLWLSDESLDAMQGLVVVFDDDGVPAAWVASNIWTLDGKRCFYANSAGVHPRHQGAGLSSTIWRALLAPELRRAAPRRLYAVTRTGNPLVYGAWSTAAGGPENVFPKPGARAPDRIRRIAAAAAQQLGQLDRFDAERLIIRNAYDFTEAGLWSQRPGSDQTDTERWFGESLGPLDAFVVVLSFDFIRIALAEAVRAIRRRLGLGTGGWAGSSRA